MEDKIFKKYMTPVLSRLKKKLIKLNQKIEHRPMEEYFRLTRKSENLFNQGQNKKWKTQKEIDDFYGELSRINIERDIAFKKGQNYTKNLDKWYDEKAELEWEIDQIRRELHWCESRMKLAMLDDEL